MIKILDKAELMNVSIVFLELDGEDLDRYYKLQFPSMLFNPKKKEHQDKVRDLIELKENLTRQLCILLFNEEPDENTQLHHIRLGYFCLIKVKEITNDNKGSEN